MSRWDSTPAGGASPRDVPALVCTAGEGGVTEGAKPLTRLLLPGCGVSVYAKHIHCPGMTPPRVLSGCSTRIAEVRNLGASFFEGTYLFLHGH